ncbi:DUF5984 family protein [Sphingopyxis sp. 113P3]|uniref:DUF5984 family protein n=1 Tax=Sphingopyxis sp. (strain 113P3) TaxID=292913 RepID=UPI0006AD23DB|nr:DUF5984 family protein [Sphingopyxis sp. 113P3]ALC11499.1 S-adenosylmethionine:tRNA ribosyltransferase-isomerase [Sphingopyxis sp. 113P3]
MLIDFELTPIKEVVPWGTPGNHSLTWFGLTEGRYWINAGVATLFEYSDRVRHSDGSRYCDYYVARIFEDVMNMLPTILEAVPQDLRAYVSGNSGREWIKACESWSEKNLDEGAEDETWDTWERANLLLRDRFLETGYLSPSTSIVMWSDETDVHIEWGNRDKFIDGGLAWSAVSGSFHLPREKFVMEVEAFHARLFERMTSRIEQVAAGALHPDVQIDLPGLIAENERRQGMFAQALGQKGATPWDEIRSAVFEISADAASND